MTSRLLDTAFCYRDQDLYAEDVRIADLASTVGTPFYLYSTASMARQYRHLKDSLAGLDALICYAVKANSNQAVIATMKELGAGADVVSQGELLRALAAGVPANRIVFAGVGKRPEEMRLGLEKGILQFNVESWPELDALEQEAQALGVIAPVALRINPDVDAKTHAKITTGTAENKFGVTIAQAREIAAAIKGRKHVRLEALAMHIGSQLVDMAPYNSAFERMAGLARELQADGHQLRRLDVGGGLGIDYGKGQGPADDQVATYAGMVRRHFADFKLPLVLEPGRYLIGNAGLMVSQVVYIKKGKNKQFAILDSAMNDLIRPTLYDAHHSLVPLRQEDNRKPQSYDLVGPVCETGDTFAQSAELAGLEAGDLVAFQSAGAYSAVMASTYNSRRLVPEVLVKGASWSQVRERQSFEALIAQDTLPSWLEGS